MHVFWSQLKNPINNNWIAIGSVWTNETPNRFFQPKKTRIPYLSMNRSIANPPLRAISYSVILHNWHGFHDDFPKNAHNNSMWTPIDELHISNISLALSFLIRTRNIWNIWSTFVRKTVNKLDTDFRTLFQIKYFSILTEAPKHPGYQYTKLCANALDFIYRFFICRIYRRYWFSIFIFIKFL